ncbi:XRE family transcriptional regulator [Maricaulis maris]|uniref:XRE family transcriptional regulator n=1 Tax=Maricaulis maris TaxID=74318 RepID=UPI003B8D76F8
MSAEPNKPKDSEVLRKRAAVKRAMQSAEMTVSSWSKLAGISEGTLRAYLAGRTSSLREDTARRLAHVVNKSLDELYEDTSTNARKRVWVRGLLTAAGKIETIEGQGLYEVTIPPGLADHDQYIAYELRGFAMSAVIPDRWIVFCVAQSEADHADIIGQGCAVETREGEHHFRRVQRGYKPGRFNLESFDGAPLIEDVELAVAYPFVAIANPGTVKI